MLTSNEMKNIVELYDLGTLERYEPVTRIVPLQQECFTIFTSKGKFFLKQYRKLSYFVEKGLELIDYLIGKGYPCIKVFKCRSGRSYVIYNRRAYAIFEFMDEKQQTKLSAKDAFALGKALGKFHALTVDFPITRTFEGYEYLLESFEGNYCRKKDAPSEVHPIFEYVKRNIEHLKVPASLPKSASHGDFTLEHVRFKNGKLFKVIDWDLASHDFMFYDLGTTMTCAFKDSKLDFAILAAIVNGYSSERELTIWERNHLFEALQFGKSKAIIWSLENIEQCGWKNDSWKSNEFMKMNKEEFDKRLGKEMQ